MIWRNLSLGGKLTVAFGSITLILAIVAIWAITGVGSIVKKCDGQPKPPDFVSGEATAQLHDMIVALMEDICGE